MSACLRVFLALLVFAFPLIAFLPPIGAERAASVEDIPIEPLPPGVTIETVVSNANQVVAMDFTPDGRLLYTERTGKLQVVAPGQAPVTAYSFPVLADGERGLLGVAVDPNFAVNHFVWVYFTRQTTATDCGGTIKNRVVRIILNDDNTVTADPEGAGCFPVYQPAPGYYVSIHNGGNLHFGPDGKLYIAVGNSNEETTDPNEPAQNLASPLGKIHRYNPTLPLSAPSDNPFVTWPNADKSNYAYGLRNPFDFTFDPISQQIFAVDNGDKCDDEINLIRPGYNYGWRLNYPQTPLPCDDDAGPDPRYNTIPPLYHWTQSVAPTGITFYTGDLIPEWKNDLFMCAFKDRSTALHHFKLNAARTAIVSHTILSDTLNHQPIRCRTDVLTGPDGTLVYSEGGGYYNGPIKRLTRASSFNPSTVSVDPAAVRAGDVFTYTFQIRHAGTASNTFEMIAYLSPSTTVKSLSAGLIKLPGQPGLPDWVYWSSELSRSQALTGTLAVTVTDSLTTPYVITTPIDIRAFYLPAPDIHLSTTTLVNSLPVFLPLILR